MWYGGELSHGEFKRAQLYLVSGGIGRHREAERDKFNALIREGDLCTCRFFHLPLIKRMKGHIRDGEHASARMDMVYRRVVSLPAFQALHVEALHWVRNSIGQKNQLFHREAYAFEPIVVLAVSCKSGMHRSVGMIRSVAEATDKLTPPVRSLQIDTASTFQPQ